MKPLIALMQPSSGLRVPHKGAAKAFYRPTKRGLDRLELEQGSSMLPRVFNMLWADALNLRCQHAITHAAMIHDDVAPEEGWLDILLDELERTGADMISAVVPIKNGRGLTSTAVENPDDPWVVRRLTLKEVFALPETFEAKDVPWNTSGAPLLPNTGLWLCKFDPAWVEKVCFKFVNRIAKMPDGQFTGQDMPEDWDFGRQLHSFGCKVVCTRKVKLDHEQPQFHNRSAWGDWPTDMAWLQYTKAQRGAVDGLWKFPGDVEGWLTETEGRTLAALAQGKAVLEIGSYCGRSTICLAQTAESVHAVDPFDGRATTVRQDTLTRFMENVVRYGVLEKITVLQGESQMVVPNIDQKFDLAFIDGAHDRMSVLGDADMAIKALAPGGLLAFHDYSDSDPGVMAAVDCLVARGAKLLDLTGTLAVVDPGQAA